ncbi:MAG: hypothetical protein JW784_02975 [Candidatus Cloacimonetes bacterium]|nr:hypothetical protein [Candidatus Cloacimonadota bacterium]
MNIKTCSILCLFLIILSGCTVKYYPVPSPEVRVSEEFGVVETEDFVLAAANQYWVKEPQELTDYFTTFYITYKNRTGNRVEIRQSDLSLLDQQGNQLDAVHPEYVLELLTPEEITFDPILPLTSEQQMVYETWKEAKNNLLSESFSFGMILPEAQKSGFVYFPKLKSKNLKCTLVFRGSYIPFSREK